MTRIRIRFSLAFLTEISVLVEIVPGQQHIYKFQSLINISTRQKSKLGITQKINSACTFKVKVKLATFFTEKHEGRKLFSLNPVGILWCSLAYSLPLFIAKELGSGLAFLDSYTESRLVFLPTLIFLSCRISCPEKKTECLSKKCPLEFYNFISTVGFI